MKKLLLISVFLISSNAFCQKLVWQSYVDENSDRSFAIEFYDDGSVFTQGIDFNYIRDGKYMDLFNGIDGIKNFINDVKSVQKKKRSIVNDLYKIEKGSFGSAIVNFKNIPRPYTFTKYAIKDFEKQLK